jgi:uncharacterized protein YndB with AHSA1/START domain
MSDSFSIERSYDATPEQIFAAWTDANTLSRWFGCGDGMLWRIHEWDARAGGRIHVSLEFPDGTYEVTGSFTIVDAPRHLRYRWATDETVDVRIEAEGAGSRVRLEHSWPFTDEDRSMIAAGWTSALRQLTSAAGSPIARP